MPTLFKRSKHLMNCKNTTRPWTCKYKPMEHSRDILFVMALLLTIDSLYSLDIDLASILLIICSVFLYMRKHKWKRGHIYSNYVPGSSLHWCELQYFA